MQRVVYLSAVSHLFKLIDRLCCLHSDLEQIQDPSHDVDNNVRDLSRGADVTDVSTNVVKHDGFDELGSDTLGELWGGFEAVLSEDAVEFLEDQI